jgi:hypothetical protein
MEVEEVATHKKRTEQIGGIAVSTRARVVGKVGDYKRPVDSAVSDGGGGRSVGVRGSLISSEERIYHVRVRHSFRPPKLVEQHPEFPLNTVAGVGTLY